MNNLSTEKIEIDEKEYTLFLNRKGIVSWEKITKLQKNAKSIQEKYNNLLDANDDKEIEVKDGDNPFELGGSEEIDELEKDQEMMKDIYIKFYWIALYEHHKLNITDVKELFAKAEKEYGLEQLILLANQMIEDANKDLIGNATPKKLTALKPTK